MCNTDKTQLILYLYGELTGPEKAGFEKHLESCPECRSETADYHKILDKLSTMPMVEPSNVMALEQPYRRHKAMTYLTYGAIAASFILVAIISYLKLSTPIIVRDNQTAGRLTDSSPTITRDYEKYSWNVSFTDEVATLRESVNTLGLILDTSMPESIDNSIEKIDYAIKSISEEEISSDSD